MSIGKFSEFYVDVTKDATKIPQEQYLAAGRYPIIDQGQKSIAGMWDNPDGLYEKVPAIVFGDHTRTIKYVDTPFFIGADGVKVLRPVQAGDNVKYLFYVLQAARIPNLGYSRHFKVVKELKIRMYPRKKQDEIVRVLEQIDSLLEQRQNEILLMDQLVKSRFVEMFGEPIANTHSLPLISLSEVGSWNSGGTPSRSNPAYFEGDIDWYSAGELNTLYLEGSVEKITQDALENSTAKLFPAGSMLVGMYDTAAFKMGILKWSSASNQACACIAPNNSIDIVWLYHVLQIMKPHFLEQRRGIRQKNLNLGMIKSFQIPYASKPEQNRFAAFVAEVDKSKLAVKQSLEKLETLKKSLMQQYFE